MPGFFDDPSQFAGNGFGNIIDGELNVKQSHRLIFLSDHFIRLQWNAAWPIGVTSESMDATLQAAGSSPSSLASTGVSSKAQTAVKGLMTDLTFDNKYISALNDLGNKLYLGTGMYRYSALW